MYLHLRVISVYKIVKNIKCLYSHYDNLFHVFTCISVCTRSLKTLNVYIFVSRIASHFVKSSQFSLFFSISHARSFSLSLSLSLSHVALNISYFLSLIIFNYRRHLCTSRKISKRRCDKLNDAWRLHLRDYEIHCTLLHPRTSIPVKHNGEYRHEINFDSALFFFFVLFYFFIYLCFLDSTKKKLKLGEDAFKFRLRIKS